MLSLWRFNGYIHPGGRDAIADWYRHQDERVQGAFDVVLEHLQQRVRADWRRPAFDLLSGKMRGIGEVRFQANRVQHRILGFFGPANAEFTLLIAASKKGRSYNPRDALDTAVKRRAEVLADGSRCSVLNV
jgi:hypothetical protein